jgi:hypothetical protein
MTAAERSARRYRRLHKSINKRRRAQHKRKVESKANKVTWAERQRRYEQRREPLNGMTYPPEHRTGAFWEQLADLAAGSVAMVLLDLPWEDTAAPLYPLAGELAARILMPGGSLICWSGDPFRDIPILNRYLQRWKLLVMPLDPYNVRPRYPPHRHPRRQRAAIYQNHTDLEVRQVSPRLATR